MPYWQARALAAAYALHVIEGWRRVTVSLGATPAPGALGVTDLKALTLRDRTAPQGMLTFADLGLSPLEQSGEDVDFVVPFTLGELRVVPNHLIAMLHVRASAPGHIDAVLNGRAINAFSVAAGTQTLRVPIAVSALRGKMHCASRCALIIRKRSARPIRPISRSRAAGCSGRVMAISR